MTHHAVWCDSTDLEYYHTNTADIMKTSSDPYKKGKIQWQSYQKTNFNTLNWYFPLKMFQQKLSTDNYNYMMACYIL